MAKAALVQLNNVDASVASLKTGKANVRRPLFIAARYLEYGKRCDESKVLDFDLRLQGLSVLKDGLFSRRRLRLTEVAFLWCSGL